MNRRWRCVIGISLCVMTSAARADEPRPPTGRFEIGAGFGPDEGFVARAEVAQDDLFGTGQHLGMVALLSMHRQIFAIRHEVPDLLDSGFTLRTELFSTRRAFPGFAREGTGGSVTVGHALGRDTHGYLRYTLEHVELDAGGGLDTAAVTRRAAPPATPLGEGRFASMRAGVVHDTLDARHLARRGSRLELHGELYDRRFGSEHDLVRVGGSVDHARGFGPFTLRLHGAAAHVRTRDGSPVPLSQRFHHGGHGDLVGRPVGSVGPWFELDGHLASAGTDFIADGRVELELPVWRAAGISIAGFAEAGVRGTTLYPTVGASLIWRSPIGPLRFDLAYLLDDRERGGVFSFRLF